MHRYLKKLVDERNSLTGLMQSVTDKAVAEDRELTDGESDRMRGWQERAAQLDAECAEQSEYLESQRSWARLQDRLTAENGADDAPGSGGTALATRGGNPSGWGETFVSSAAFTRYDGHGTSGRVELPGLFERAAIDTSFLAVPPYVFSPATAAFVTPLLDAVGRERVSTNAIEWLTWSTPSDAAVVPEGALKPEATLTPTTGAAALETLAHYKGITRQALEDIPRIQSIIESALRQGILSKLEANVAAALTTNTDIPAVTGEDMLQGIRVGIATVQSAGYTQPNAVLLNPSDYASLDLSVMHETVDGPKMGATYWGLRPIPVADLAVGTAYVGDFKTAVTLFERGSASVYLTDSHADFFLRNTLVVLAETRALAVVTEPQAAVKVTAAPPAGGAVSASPSRANR
jgi:HK97 family phage major capsid protein